MKGKNMNLAFGLEEIYEDAEFQIGDLDKVGIVGVNGAGKTTLFRLLLGELELDNGSLTSGNARIGYLPQEIVLEDEDITVWDFLFEGRPIKKYEQELEEIYKKLETAVNAEQEALLARMGTLQERLEYFDFYEAETILLEFADKMSIDAELYHRPMRELSGGQKSKMAFARLLYSKPEILLLDEPTNHLDVSTKDFVIKYLKNYRGSVLIISHDIDFLNRIINKIMYINKATHKISVYDGDYYIYKKKYAEEQRIREMAIVQQEKEIKELSDFVQKAKQASQTNHHLKRMGQERALRLDKKRGELQKRNRLYKRVKMDIRPKREGAQVPLEVENITFHYSGYPTLYQNLSFQINGRERFLVVGENGVGKSTLLKLMMGILSPDEGCIRFNQKTDIAYYAQELEQLDENKTVIDNVESEGYTPWQIRAVLSNFLFYDDDVNKKVSVLSPGEKARVALCKILLQKANLLILDEPTNHLDPETQKIIGGNFNLFEGTIIAVSHNPSFVEQIGISRMLILPSGRIEPYSRELLEYYYEINTPEEEQKY
ncbi:ABC-F type ribosomal protection protein PoxtA2 [Enterococcus hulanensis]|uniref:ARE-ABC-F family resistance factor PoxtA2 n=14 Tax=Bacilli TaxID=91061 RepID=A0A8E8U758_ENTGA|nr:MULTISPECIES: ABC-F type ribosomal protection protein PoxtA2 [Enterococcus]MBP1520040.1 ABC transporter ATP-binding protein [Enterococcus faecalis]MBW3682385.1 ABC transporter ATP-binding protein [Enterococcus faecalis]MBW3736971.1 ABC transporter ATP-binding protein [Enterococcus faecalis]MDT2163752.1 ABC-F type ribosomal protection protein PoxtA2 [Enterococcus faecalis]MDT2540471.1 ABC-F type ribosomal protection protein PoxtA2 [Enterococcus raffinosus]